MADKFLDKTGLIQYEAEQKKRYDNLNKNKAENSTVTNLTSTVNNKVDKVSGKDLVSTSDINQITTNKNDISSLTSTVGNKVDKVSGKELVSTSDISQITTNKNNIANLTTTVNSKADTSTTNNHETRISNLESQMGNVATKLENLI